MSRVRRGLAIPSQTQMPRVRRRLLRSRFLRGSSVKFHEETRECFGRLNALGKWRWAVREKLNGTSDTIVIINSSADASGISLKLGRLDGIPLEPRDEYHFPLGRSKRVSLRSARVEIALRVTLAAYNHLAARVSQTFSDGATRSSGFPRRHGSH